MTGTGWPTDRGPVTVDGINPETGLPPAAVAPVASVADVASDLAIDHAADVYGIGPDGPTDDAMAYAAGVEVMLLAVAHVAAVVRTGAGVGPDAPCTDYVGLAMEAHMEALVRMRAAR